MTSSKPQTSGIRDNHHRGTIGEFLKEKILQGSDLSFVSAYFTIYDLVVIDESHNFRNNARGNVQEDGTCKTTRYEFLMEHVLQTGVDTKVLLLSATPVNNSLKDLQNQFLLITQNQDGAFHESLGISSIAQAMKNAQTRRKTRHARSAVYSMPWIPHSSSCLMNSRSHGPVAISSATTGQRIWANSPQGSSQ